LFLVCTYPLPLFAAARLYSVAMGQIGLPRSTERISSYFFQFQNFPVAEILPFIDIWRPLKLISRISGLAYCFFHLSFFSFRYRYFFFSVSCF